MSLHKVSKNVGTKVRLRTTEVKQMKKSSDKLMPEYALLKRYKRSKTYGRKIRFTIRCTESYYK